MAIVLTILIIIVAILLILVVLIQNSKGGGLSSTLGGGASQLMGVKKTGDALEKVTWGLAIGVLVLSLTINLFVGPTIPRQDINMSPNIQRAQEQAPSGPLQPSPDEEGDEGGLLNEGTENDLAPAPENE